MKILVIRGRNIASLTQPFELDFQQGLLAQSGLFAIAGPTGAGKSSLLDTLCLALFDNVPRINRNKTLTANIGEDKHNALKSNDIRSVISRGAVEALAEVEFLATDGLIYKVSWSARRARNKITGRWLPQEIVLMCINQKPFDNGSNALFSGKKKALQEEINQLIGLNYEQFRRAVLLAQGDFAAFLKADSKQRSDLLEKMTGSEVYSVLSKQAHEKGRHFEEGIKQLESRAQGVQLLPADSVEAITSEIANVSVQHQNTQLLLTQLAKMMETAKLIDDQVDVQTEKQSQLSQIQQQQAEIDTLSKALQDFEQLLPYLNEFKTAEKIKSNVAQLESQAVSYLSQHKALTSTTETLATNITRVAEQWQHESQQYIASQPNREQASKLDQNIENQQQQLALLQKNKQQNQYSLKQINTEKTALSSHITQCEVKLVEQGAFLAQNEALMPVSQQWQFIRTSIEQIQQSRAQQYHIETELAALKQTITHLPLKQQTLMDEQQALNNQSSQLAKQLSEIQIDNQQDWAEINRLITPYLALLVSLQRQLQDQDACRQAINEQRQLQVDLKAEEAQLKQQVSTTLNLFEHTTLRLDEAQYALTRSQQVLDVSALREQLKPNEPCTVCGSESHPYKEGDLPVQGLMDELNQRVLLLKTEHGALQSDLHLTQSKLPLLTKQIHTTVEQLEALTDKQQGYTLLCNESTEALSAYTSRIEHLPEMASFNIASINWADFTLVDVVALTAATEAVLAASQQHLKLQTERQQKQQNINSQLHSVNLRLNQVEQGLLTLKSEQQLCQQTQQQFEAQLVTLIDKQATFLPAIQLMDQLSYLPELVNWADKLHLTEDVIALLSFLEQLLTQYHQVLAQQEAAQKVQQANKAQFALVSQQYQQLETALTLINEQEQGYVQLHTELIAQRQGLLGGESVQAFEKSSQDNIQQLQLHKQDLQNQLAEQTSKLQLLTQQLADIHTQKDNSQLQLVAHEQQIADILQQNKISNSTCQYYLTLPSEWPAEQREAIKQHDKLMQTTQTEFDEVTKQLAEQQKQLRQIESEVLRQYQPHSCYWLDEKPQATLEALKSAPAIAQFQEQLHNQMIELKAQLQADEQQKQQQSDTYIAIEKAKKEAKYWLQLKDLIGSADGHKFRSIAQNYTLYQLVNIANHHLAELVPRYQLEVVPDANMELQVKDADLADAIRNVESLSGGETFLVSLALALALSSLSSNRVVVDSLFIDEGFGTLDPASLDMVIACLDSLQAQGKHIGIITHVNSMVERIGLRVNVQPQGGGHSTVAIDLV